MKRVRVLQPVLHSSGEGWRVASDFRSALIEPLIYATKVQDAYSHTGRVSDQVRGLVCHDRSKRLNRVCFEGPLLGTTASRTAGLLSSSLSGA